MESKDIVKGRIKIEYITLNHEGAKNLAREGIVYIDQINQYSDNDLRKIRRVGPVFIQTLRELAMVEGVVTLKKKSESDGFLKTKADMEIDRLKADVEHNANRALEIARERDQLMRWKSEMLELWNKLDEYLNTRKDITIGQSKIDRAIEIMKEYDVIKNNNRPKWIVH